MLKLFFDVCWYDRHLYLQFIVSSQICTSEDLDNTNNTNASKRRKVFITETDEVSVNCVETKSADIDGIVLAT